MKVITRDGLYDEFAIILEINDEMLDRIKSDSKYYLDQEFASVASLCKGNNAFIPTLFCKKDFEIINNMIRYLLDSYDTVTWWDKDSCKFYTKRRRKCQQQFSYQ